MIEAFIKFEFGLSRYKLFIEKVYKLPYLNMLMKKIGNKPSWVWANGVRGDLNRHTQELIYHLNHRANWLITISSFILVLVISNLFRFNTNLLTKIGLLVLVIGSLISLISLMLILVPYIKTSKNYVRALDEDIFYFRNISKNFSKLEFIEYIGRIRTDAKELDKIYAASIYNNSVVRLPSITAKLKVGGWSLIFGLVFGSIFMLLGFLI